MASNDLSDIKTPPSCTADFCLIPLGTPTASVSKEVAEVQRILKKSGLNYSMHSAGTTLGVYLMSIAGCRTTNRVIQRAHGTTACESLGNAMLCCTTTAL